MKTLQILFITILLSTLMACNKTPIEQLEEKIFQLEEILTTNNNDPNQMLDELETFVNDNRDFWPENKRQLSQISPEKLERITAIREEQTQQHYINITNLLLEYQQRFQNEPEKLKRLNELMKQLTPYQNAKNL